MHLGLSFGSSWGFPRFSYEKKCWTQRKEFSWFPAEGHQSLPPRSNVRDIKLNHLNIVKGHLQYFNGHKKWGSRQSSQESLGHSTFVLVAQCHDPWAGGRLGPTLYDPVPFLVAMTFWISNRNGTQLQGTCKVMTWDKPINVNPGFINPERLFNWEGTIKKYQMKWLLEEYPPNYHKPCLSLIQGWHYNTLYLLCSEYITCIPTPIFHINSDSAVFHLRLSPKLLLNQVRMLLTCSHSTLEKNDKQVRLGGGGVEG